MIMYNYEVLPLVYYRYKQSQYYLFARKLCKS